MSERRQLTLLLVGAVVLAGVGFFGAQLFPEGCDDLVRQGELSLEFTDAVDALSVSSEDAATLEALGDELGIGRWRGAVALPDDAGVSRSEFGFFVWTDEAVTVLRPSFGLASASRGRVGLDVIPAGTNIALRAADGEVGVFDGEYELARCGSLPADAEVLALDRGFAVVRDGDEVVLHTLSGGEQWRAPETAGAHVGEQGVVLGENAVVELRDLRDGEVLERFTPVAPNQAGPAPVGEVPWAWAADGTLLLRNGPSIQPVELGTAALAEGDVLQLPLPDAPVIDAVGTPAGIVALGATDVDGGRLATDRSDTSVSLPAGVAGRDLLASNDGNVGLVVEVGGERALLVWGPDRPAAS